MTRPGFHVLALHRIGHAAIDLEEPPRLSIRLLRKGLKGLIFITQAVYGIELPLQTKIGRRLVIGHQNGIVIARGAVIGDDCLIRQNVTIGAAVESGRSPRIGHCVSIGAGAVIIGDIVIGDGAIIGPNAVVTTDVPPGARVVAAPSRILVGPDKIQGDSIAQDGGEPAGTADAEAIASLIREALDLKTAIEPDTPLLSSGIVDSLNVALVLDALESRYAVTVQSEDVSAESFDTPRQIADYLRDQRS